MSNSNLTTYLIDPASFNAESYGLGKFIVGYTDERVKFNKKLFLWLLFPFVGWAIFLIFLINHYLKFNFNRISFFENGILQQVVSRKGSLKSEIIFRYDEIQGVSISRTRQYTNSIYSGTLYFAKILDNNLTECNFLHGSYRNENEVVEKYDFSCHVLDTLINQWYQKAIDKFNAEMREQGYGVFYSGKNQVQVGKDFLRVGDNYVSHNFKYSFSNGMLNIFPQASEEGSFFQKKAKDFRININEMYNKEVFLLAVNQFLGIK